MNNPDKYIRKAYLTALANIGTPIYVDEVPVNITPIPANRILISTQTKTATAKTNCGHTWDTSILLDIISEQQRSFVNRDTVDDIEEAILSVVDNKTFPIPPFTVTYTNIQEAHSSNLDTPTTTVIRKILRITHKINYL